MLWTLFENWLTQSEDAFYKIWHPMVTLLIQYPCNMLLIWGIYPNVIRTLRPPHNIWHLVHLNPYKNTCDVSLCLRLISTGRDLVRMHRY
jgi:hypothetical protein